MRETDRIGSQADSMQPQSIKPKYYPCPQRGTQGKRQRVMTRRLAHVAALQRRSSMVADSTLRSSSCVAIFLYRGYSPP
jgi:hypothetical protein